MAALEREDILKTDTSCYQTIENNGPQRLEIPPGTEMVRSVLVRRRDTDNWTGDLERQTATKTGAGSMMGKTRRDRDCLILCASDLLFLNLTTSVPRLQGRHEVLGLE